MPSIAVNSANINTFSWSASIDLQKRVMTFDTSATTYNGIGISNVLGIAISVLDSAGIELAGVDWTAPQIKPSVSQTYQLDLTSLPINFLFQNYQFIAYIKDADGTVYSTLPILKEICQPVGINESGYVDGLFSVTPDCVNNILTVKELTVFVYNNLVPKSVTKTGTLFYPTGTISAISFTNTPFTNNVIYTGTNRVNCTSIATYDLGDGITVLVSYYTDHEFPVVCSNFMGDITCCLSDTYDTYIKNCDNAIGQAALQRYNSAFLPFSLGFLKQINGQDASGEVAQIKKLLNCNCGSSSVSQNQSSPINPAVYSILLQGQGATTVLPAYIVGSTKVFNIASSSYVVGKGNTGDLAFTVSVDRSVSNVVKYLVTFNYDTMALYVLNAINANPTLLNQLNSLITTAGGSIAGLNGKCVIDLTKSNYAVSQSVNSSTLITNIVINGANFAAPSNLFATDTVSVAGWLNGLSLGSFTAVVNSGILTIQSVSNTNKISSVTFTTPNITKLFSSTNATLVQVLQAIVDYICNLTDLQVLLANNLNLYSFDYNGNFVATQYKAGISQSLFNAGIASAIYNIGAQISKLTSVSCDTIKALFTDKPTVSFGASDRLYGTLGGNCASLTDQQIANMVIAAIGKYSDVKTAFCAINCNAIPSCPEVSNTSINMSGSNIGVYGLTWSSAPVASQTVSVKYRVSGTITWSVATNSLLILPNGTISGTTPFLITGLSAGTTYDVLIINNCGGSGFTKQITTPTGSVYSGSYLLENTTYAICGATPVTLYSSNPFGSGVIMYTNIGLTSPVTGYTYITTAGSDIYAINNTTGLVGADTGSSCSNGTAGSYQLGNSTSTICAAATVTLYTNGAFAVGKTIYTDAALTNPQVGYSYVVYSGYIYTVNSGTGAVTGTSGLSCLNYTLSPAYNFSIQSVTGAGVPTLPPTGTTGNVYGHHTAMSGNYSITLAGTIVTTTKLDLSVNGTVVATANVTAAGTFVLACTATETDNVLIAVDKV